MKAAFYIKHLHNLTNAKFVFVDVDTESFRNKTNDFYSILDAKCDILIFGSDTARAHNSFGRTFLTKPVDSNIRKKFLASVKQDFYIDDALGDNEIEVFDRDYADVSICQSIEQLNLQKPWIYLTSNFAYSHPNAVFYPIWFINTCELTKEDNIQVDIKSSRSKLGSFMMFAPWKDRLVALANLSKQSFFKDFYYNFPKISPELNSQPSLTSSRLHYPAYRYAVESFLNEEERTIIKKFVDAGEHFADPNDHIDSQYKLGQLTNCAFFDSYINVFGESGYPHPNVTEKSALPFLAGQFPMIYGGAGLTEFIEKLGFDTFREFIPNVNQSHRNLREKIQIFSESIERMADILPNLWDQTYERRLHNYNLIRSENFMQQLQQPLLQRLNA